MRDLHRVELPKARCGVELANAGTRKSGRVTDLREERQVRLPIDVEQRGLGMYVQGSKVTKLLPELSARKCFEAPGFARLELYG